MLRVTANSATCSCRRKSITWVRTATPRARWLLIWSWPRSTATAPPLWRTTSWVGDFCLAQPRRGPHLYYW